MSFLLVFAPYLVTIVLLGIPLLTTRRWVYRTCSALFVLLMLGCVHGCAIIDWDHFSVL